MDTQVEHIYKEFSSLDDLIIEGITKRGPNEKPFYVADMQDIYRKHMRWLELLPRVRPFYAVKCNNLPEIVSFMAMLGTGFDCASKAEIDQVLAAGVDPSAIVYANPCKTRSFIKHAKAVNVNLMTFDNELELHKVAATHPNAELILRIKGDDRTSRCKFNIKFGADLDKCESLLMVARDLGLTVVGVSFHNGSDCEDSSAYTQSIANCRSVFDIGLKYGHNMRIVDIGGGFPGHDAAADQLDELHISARTESNNNVKLQRANFVSFEKLTEVINAALDKHFPSLDSLTGLATDYDIIAEPGRYYVASALTLVSMVVAKRVEPDDKTGADCFMYYLNDGVYGAFNNIIFEQATPTPKLICGGRKALAASMAAAAAKSVVAGSAVKGELDNNIFGGGVGGGLHGGVGGGRGLVGCAGSEFHHHDDDGGIDEPKLHSTVLWGPTCDSVDCVKRDFKFPELEVGEWIQFNNMGAYTCSAASNFNGFEKATVIVAL